jgi:hypothetical protein
VSNIKISLPKPTSSLTLTRFFLDYNKLNSFARQYYPLSTTKFHKVEREKRKILLEIQLISAT